MTRLSIRHETIYRYDRAVGFGAHRMMVRPRDSHADRLVEASLELSLPGDTRWVYDALGNSVCWYFPQGQTTELSIVSNLVIERFPAPLQITDPQTAVPIVYSLADRAVLGPFIAPATESDLQLLTWVRAHMGRYDEPVLDFLTRLTQAIHAEFSYGERNEPGVQLPGQTIAWGTGTCRDFAWLMIESLRRLGFAARFITGYLYSPKTDPLEVDSTHLGAGSTHAWCEVFLPSLGWMEFDPTNGFVESPDLIRIAAVRTPDEAAPISGGIVGNPGSSSMSVKVEVRLLDEPSQAVAPHLFANV